MSTTTQFTTFSDLYNGLLKAVRSDPDHAATIEQAKRYINTALADMHLGFAENVPWALREHSFSTETTFTSTVDAVGAGTITTPNSVLTTSYDFDNPDANTFSFDRKIAITTSLTGASVGLEGTQTTVSATTADPAVIDVTGSGFLVGDSVRVYQDEITLPDDFMRLAGNQVRVSNRTLDMLGRVEFRHRFAGKYDINKPQYATLIDTNDALSGIDNRKLRLFPIPSSVERGFLTYVTKDLVTAADGEWKEEFDLDTDEPIVPRRYRHAIFLHALSNWYRDRKDDTRSQEAFAQYQQIMSRIINDTEAGQSNLRIRPGLRSYRRKAGRPYRRGGRGSKYDFGRFDELR